ncbi:hypothetical protein D1BOALGB6SA_841 [Olavius sp. associated proteobacterium Delta 1]|nr:hypothetical protein D1BOALGB6SA_841 [Olavius sp. associated proteobacterium Delta 1]
MNASKEQKAVRPQRHIQLEMAAERIPVFFELLRSGFSADITVGCSLEHMLCDQMNIAPDYLQNRAQTVFLNSSPVDDLATAAVAGGAVISLSAAMPGLNGAVMRRGGPLAAMRRSISHAPDEVSRHSLPGRITLKLFNLVAKELGPQFLTRGIVVSSKALGELLMRQTSDFWQAVKSAEVDHSPCQVDQLVLHEWPEQEVLFQVQTN